MVGELNDAAIFGNEKKQRGTASARRMRREKGHLGATLIYLMSPRFLIRVSCALSIWEDRTWHFAMSVSLTESYGHSVLLPAGFGLVVAGSLLIFGVLIGDWIDRKSRNRGTNEAVQRLGQIINIFAPLSVDQVLTWAPPVIGGGFIFGWNLVSLLVEFLFLSRVYQRVPQLAVKSQQQAGGPS